MALLLTLGSGAACASAPATLPRPAAATLPAASPLRVESLSDVDAWLRHHLIGGQPERAVALLADDRYAPDDDLLRSLQTGLALHHAGEYEASNERFAWAEQEADRRYTRSLRRAAASLAVNDLMLAYLPGLAEMAMIPYYRMLNYLALGQVEAAQVEARKANELDARLSGDSGECAQPPLVQYLAGLVHELGSDANAALVSLRRAERGFDACGSRDGSGAPAGFGRDLLRAAQSLGVDEVADSAAARYGLGDAARLPGGRLVVLIEEGFVAHRAEEALHVPLFDRDIRGLHGAERHALTEAASRIGTRVLVNSSQRRTRGGGWYDQPWVQTAYMLNGVHVLRLSWPVYRAHANRPSAVRLVVDTTAVQPRSAASLSARLDWQLERERPAMLARLITRGLVKYLAAREIEDAAEKEGGDVLGFIAGRLANAAANELERADTRSWSLLPDRISVVEVDVPAGVHHVRIETLDSRGMVAAVHDLGRIRVEEGERVVLSRRVWEHIREMDLSDAQPALTSVSTAWD